MSEESLIPQTDRDYLELLMFKLEQKRHWAQQWFGYKQPGDERRYNEASKELNNLVKNLKKKGYDYKRYHNLHVSQNKLFE